MNDEMESLPGLSSGLPSVCCWIPKESIEMLAIFWSQHARRLLLMSNLNAAVLQTLEYSRIKLRPQTHLQLFVSSLGQFSG